MSGVALVVEVALALGVVGFVGYPFLVDRVADDEPEEMPEALEELYSRKESTYSALKELEFDYKTGKLSDVDYHELDLRFRAEAVEILEAIEAEEHPAPKPKAPTRRASGAVAASGATVGGTAVVGGRARGAGSDGEQATCLACGRGNPVGALFCGACGTSLATAGPEPKNGDGASGVDVCVDCGGVLKAGQRFCGGCGAEARA
jgi:Double zinc ribbon